MSVRVTSVVALLSSALLTVNLGNVAAQSNTTPPVIVGGYSSKDGLKNDPQVKQAAIFAVNKISKGARLLKILSVQSQVVAGLNYKFVLLTSAGTFDAIVYQGLGIPLKLTSYKIHGEQPINAPGSYSPQPGKTNDPTVKKVAQFAVSKISSNLKLRKILSVQIQVVGGFNYKLVVLTSSGKFQAVVFDPPSPDAAYQLVSYKRLDTGQ